MVLGVFNTAKICERPLPLCQSKITLLIEAELLEWRWKSDFWVNVSMTHCRYLSQWHRMPFLYQLKSPSLQKKKQQKSVHYFQSSNMLMRVLHDTLCKLLKDKWIRMEVINYSSSKMFSEWGNILLKYVDTF